MQSHQARQQSHAQQPGAHVVIALAPQRRGQGRQPPHHGPQPQQPDQPHAQVAQQPGGLRLADQHPQQAAALADHEIDAQHQAQQADPPWPGRTHPGTDPGQHGQVEPALQQPLPMEVRGPLGGQPLPQHLHQQVEHHQPGHHSWRGLQGVQALHRPEGGRAQPRRPPGPQSPGPQPFALNARRPRRCGRLRHGGGSFVLPHPHPRAVAIGQAHRLAITGLRHGAPWLLCPTVASPFQAARGVSTISLSAGCWATRSVNCSYSRWPRRGCSKPRSPPSRESTA